MSKYKRVLKKRYSMSFTQAWHHGPGTIYEWSGEIDAGLYMTTEDGGRKRLGFDEIPDKMFRKPKGKYKRKLKKEFSVWELPEVSTVDIGRAHELLRKCPDTGKRPGVYIPAEWGEWVRIQTSVMNKELFRKKLRG